MCKNIKSAAALERKALQAKVSIRDLNIAFGEIDQLPRWIDCRVAEGILEEPSDRTKKALELIRLWTKVTMNDLQMRANQWNMQAAKLRNVKPNNGGTK